MEERHKLGLGILVVSMLFSALFFVTTITTINSVSYNATELILNSVIDGGMDPMIMLLVCLLFPALIIMSIVKKETFQKNNIIILGVISVLILFFNVIIFTDSFSELIMENMGIAVVFGILGVIGQAVSTVLLYDANK